MIFIKIKEYELNKFPLPTYTLEFDEELQEDVSVCHAPPYEFTPLLQDFSKKNRSYDIIGKVEGDVELFKVSGIIYEELGGNYVPLENFFPINSKDIKCYSLDDYYYVNRGEEIVDEERMKSITNINEFRLHLDNLFLAVKLMEAQQHIQELQDKTRDL